MENYGDIKTNVTDASPHPFWQKNDNEMARIVRMSRGSCIRKVDMCVGGNKLYF